MVGIDARIDDWRPRRRRATVARASRVGAMRASACRPRSSSHSCATSVSVASWAMSSRRAASSVARPPAASAESSASRAAAMGFSIAWRADAGSTTCRGQRRQGRKSQRTGEREISGDPLSWGVDPRTGAEVPGGLGRQDGSSEEAGAEATRGLTVQEVLPRELMALALALRDELQALRRNRERVQLFVDRKFAPQRFSSFVAMFPDASVTVVCPGFHGIAPLCAERANRMRRRRVMIATSRRGASVQFGRCPSLSSSWPPARAERMASDLPKVPAATGGPAAPCACRRDQRAPSIPMPIHVVHGHGADQVRAAIAGGDIHWDAPGRAERHRTRGDAGDARRAGRSDGARALWRCAADPRRDAARISSPARARNRSRCFPRGSRIRPATVA